MEIITNAPTHSCKILMGNYLFEKKTSYNMLLKYAD